MALGLAGFALITVLSALPVGLRAVREAQSQEIAANIAQRLQASLQTISFATGGGGMDLTNLADNPQYFTEDGVETVPPTSTGGSSNPAFYKAVFAVGNVAVNDGSTPPATAPAIQPANARTITATLWYPQNGSAPGKGTFIFSFVVARQGAAN